MKNYYLARNFLVALWIFKGPKTILFHELVLKMLTNSEFFFMNL